MINNHSAKIGLALGSGGARGLVHIGILKVLSRELSFHHISGASMGAVIGAMFAATEDADWVQNRFKKFFNSEEYKSIGLNRFKSEDEDHPSFWGDISQYVKEKVIINVAIERMGILKLSRLRDAVKYMLPVTRFEELHIPFSCIAVDLNTGYDIVYNSGDLIEAVVASAAIPGYLQPVENNGQLLVDGGVSRPVPVDILKNQGADIIIAVEASIANFKAIKNPNLLKILGRAEQISSKRLGTIKLSEADVVIRPDTMDLFWSEFDHLDKLVVNGETAAEAALENIHSTIRKKRGFRGKLKKVLEQVTDSQNVNSELL